MTSWRTKDCCNKGLVVLLFSFSGYCYASIIIKRLLIKYQLLQLNITKDIHDLDGKLALNDVSLLELKVQ